MRGLTLTKVVGLIKEAFISTLSAKARVILSSLCIGLGIAGITLVAALGTAAVDKAMLIVDLYGTDSLLVFSGVGKRGVSTPAKPFTQQEIFDIKENFPDAYLIVPLRFDVSRMVSYDNSKFVTSVGSVSTSYTDEWGWKVQKGRDLSPEDNKYGTNVCVIGSYVDDNLFQGGDPIGQQIRVGNQICEVVGVYIKKSFGAGDDELNNFVNIPDSIFSKRYVWWRNGVPGIKMRFSNPAKLDEYEKDFKSYWRFVRNIPDSDEDSFMVFSSKTISKMIFTVLGALIAFLVVITLVVVAVGGIVTANMFLLATQTRIKEIGIRRAFGAVGSDIFIQFIVEFIFISFFGMLVGLAIGWTAAYVITSFGFVEVFITPGVFAITAVASLVIALVFGILPAKSAARINPIEAIRTL